MRILWTAAAAHDLTHVCDYIERHSSRITARRVALSIYERVSALDTFPERGKIGRKAGTRELIFSGLPYLAVYRIQERSQENVVEILRILHVAQDWPK